MGKHFGSAIVGPLLGVAGVLVAVGAVTPASAAPPAIGSFPSYLMTATTAPGLTYSGTANWSAATGFPATTITTNSTSVTDTSGESAFLGSSTGFGTNFGSSRAQPYLSLGTAALNSTSTTTITFAGPPPAGWGLAVGDIDADTVQIVPNDGTQDLSGATLHAQETTAPPGTLNYCNNSPKPSSCTGSPPFTDSPTWVEDTGTVRGVTYTKPTVVGSGLDTHGAYQWFLPDSTIRTITLSYSVLLGFPSFQLWLVAPAPPATIVGSIAPTGGGGLPAGVVVDVDHPDGSPVLDIQQQPVTEPVQPNGSFSITTEQAQYLLEFQVPAGYDPIPPQSVNAVGTVNLGTLALTPVGTPQQELAATGTDATAELLLGALLFGAGLVLSTISRRSMRRQSA